MTIFDYLTTEQVARHLGVTSARVRQLAAAGELPRGRSLPGLRGALYSRTAIDTWRQTRRTSLADRLPAATEPVPQVAETIHSYTTRSRDTFPLHVRHYRGPDREVVVLAVPHQAQIITNNIEHIVAALLAEGAVRTEDPMGIVWIQLVQDYQGSSRRLPGTEITNVLLRQDDAGGWTDPAWSHLSWTELAELLGHDIDTYLWEHYTPEAITAWLRRRPHPLQVVDDPDHLRDHLETLRFFRDLTNITPTARQTALHALAKTVQLFTDNYSYRQNPRPPAPEERPPSAMTLLPFTLTEDDQELLREHLPSDDLDFAQVDTGTYALLEYRQTHDEHSTAPDPNIISRVDRAMSAVATLRTYTHPDHEPPKIRDPHADVTADVAGVWDSQYLAACTWDDQRLTTRQRAILTHGWGSWPEYRTRTGLGPDGTPVAEITHIDGPQTVHLMRLLWPTEPLTAEDLAEDLVLAADGTTGDRPVYLTRSEVIVGLLPRSRPLAQWNFGYGGGGPGALAAAITDLLENAGTTVTDYQRGLIDLEVRTSPQNRLHLPLKRILDGQAQRNGA